MTIQEYEDSLLSRIVNAVKKHKYGSYVESIILTGSLGRGEPTYLITDAGYKLKSDVELALVFTHHKKQIYQLIDEVGKKFDEDINFMAIRKKRIQNQYNFNYEFFKPKYCTLFMYDFYNASKVLYGKDLIYRHKVSLDRLDPYEAKRLVANRIAETEYINARNDTYLTLQWKCKVISAIVGGWLILNKLYVSSYTKQMKIVYTHQAEFEAAFGKEFLDMYYKAYKFLRDNGDAFEVDDELLDDTVQKFGILYKKKYRGKSQTTTSIRYMKYMWKYMRYAKSVNIFDIENRIYNRILNEYCAGSDKLVKTADLWHKVLY